MYILWYGHVDIYIHIIYYVYIYTHTDPTHCPYIINRYTYSYHIYNISMELTLFNLNYVFDGNARSEPTSNQPRNSRTAGGNNLVGCSSDNSHGLIEHGYWPIHQAFLFPLLWTDSCAGWGSFFSGPQVIIQQTNWMGKPIVFGVAQL